MDKRLWGSKSALRAMIQASPLAMIAISREGKVTMWNPAAQRIFGWSEEEVLGRLPPFVPEGKWTEFRALHDRRLKGENVSGLELHRQRKDGTAILVRLWTVPTRGVTGQIDGVLGLLEDITERKRADAAFRASEEQRDAVLRSIPVALYRAQASGQFDRIWVSESVE